MSEPIRAASRCCEPRRAAIHVRALDSTGSSLLSGPVPTVPRDLSLCETRRKVRLCDHRVMGGTEGPAPAAGTLTVALDVPSAQVLADQAAIIADLQFVMECCKRLLTELAKPEITRDAVVPNALWSAALVSYARCFGKGKRFGLGTEDVRSLPLQGEVMKYHQWVLAERDKLTTHASNPFDAATIGAALSPPDRDNRQVEGIAIMATSRVLVDDTGVRQLGGLASELAKQTAEKAQKQQDTVLADAQQLSLDRLYKLPPPDSGPPPPGADPPAADEASDPH